MGLRKTIFWLHLVAGVIAGVIILVMCVTGVALAFEKEIIAWAERDVRRITPPADAKRLPLDELLAKVREHQPGVRPLGVTVHANPNIAAHVSLGRTNGFYVNPYSGEVRRQGASSVRAFMTKMIEWHRYLGTAGERRPIGKAITGASNAAFCFLGITGLYLWWPRQWTKSALRAVALFNAGLRGKARDWNWHNVIGLWCAPVLIVLTATAMPISYRWATGLIYKLTRSEAPPPATGTGAAPAVKVPTPPAGAQALRYDALLAVVQQKTPRWEQITLRLGGSSSTQPVSFAVKQREGAPRFVTAQFTLNPFTGDVLRSEGYEDYNRGRKVRSWTRFLHTGEALGPMGQFIAAVASMGGAVLVWTGLSLAFRRFFIMSS